MVKIKIHSVVDIITNSSSEIFVQASDSTIKNIKQVVTALLQAAGSNLTADDVFTFKLVDPNAPNWEYELKNWEKNYRDKMEKARAKAEAKGYDFDEAGWKEDHYYPNPGEYEPDPCANIEMQVNVKDGFTSNFAEMKKAARVLSDLTGLFNIEERYNG